MTGFSNFSVVSREVTLLLLFLLNKQQREEGREEGTSEEGREESSVTGRKCV